MHGLISRGGAYTNQSSISDGNGSNDNSNDIGENSNEDDQGTSGDSNGSSNSQGNQNNGVWVNFCKTPLEDLNLEVTNGVKIKRDLERGIWASGTGIDFFGRGVKFPEYEWKRADELPFSFVFTVRGKNPSFLFGIGSPDIDINNLGSQALFAGEIQLFYDNGRFNRFFGGSGIRNWAQDTGANIKFEDNLFYKVTFERSGKVGSKVAVYMVSKGDFDTNLDTLGTYTIVENPADSKLLIPYWNAVNTPDIFITAVQYFR